MEPFIGQIMMFGGDFAPRGWEFCNGQILSISDHQALFSLIGTIYGGDGRTTFVLPDLRGRAPIHSGKGPGLSESILGEPGGNETTSLSINNMPTHSHVATFTQTAGTVTATGTLPVNNEEGNAEQTNPSKGILGTGESEIYSSEDSNGNYRDPISVTGTANVTGTVTNDAIGGSEIFSNMQPYLTVNFIIALEGIYPSRS